MLRAFHQFSPRLLTRSLVLLYSLFKVAELCHAQALSCGCLLQRQFTVAMHCVVNGDVFLNLGR